MFGLKKKEIALKVIKQAIVNGIPMGVLSDESTYVSGRGLAELCGVSNVSIVNIAENWKKAKLNAREQKIKDILNVYKYTDENLFLDIQINNVSVQAYPEKVCMAIIEYYALEQQMPQALNSFRIMAMASLREYIYVSTGYKKQKEESFQFRDFHARLTMNQDIPYDFFSILKESNSIVMKLFNMDAITGPELVPDISIGMKWSQYWCENNMSETHSERKKFPHKYPDWYPQSDMDNIEAWIYPVSSLGEFKLWLHTTYLSKHFPKYLREKVSQGLIDRSKAQLLIARCADDETLKSVGVQLDLDLT